MSADNEDKGMMVDLDEFTPADREALRDLNVREAPRTVETVREVEDGTLVQHMEKREMFTFTEAEMGTIRFDVRSIKDSILAGRIPRRMYRIAEVPRSFYEHVLANNGVEQERLPKINGRDLERPGIMVDWGNGFQTMIDGNHRMVRRCDLGMPGFRFLLVPVGYCAPHMCRPGEEEKLFHRERPGVELLHSEIKME